MSKKSIFLAILALLLYIAFAFGIVFLFKVHFMLGIVGIALLYIPFKIQRKAIDEASGKLDEIFAKYITPIVFAVVLVFVVLYFTLWMK